MRTIFTLILSFFLTSFYCIAQDKPAIEWVDIAGGTFEMGSPSGEDDRYTNETRHKVTLSPFKMSKYEITFDQYDAFCEATNRIKPKDNGWGRGKRPVINVSWFDAKAFAEWIGGRLPTEAEWEYACRAGTKTTFNTGKTLTTDQANYNGNYPYKTKPGIFRGQTLPVGSFAPNAWGLHDMHGNLWEWCSDWYGEYDKEKTTNPTGPENGNRKIIRGGSWDYRGHDCRSALRFVFTPDYHMPFMGIRIVKDVK